MAQISFSIVVVCLNPGKKLACTIESVLMQQYGNYEILVKDGGSVDGSLEELPADSRIRLLTGADRGIYDAMNQALTAVTGQYVLFLNCGDVFHDEQVLTQMAAAIGRKQASGGTEKDEGRQYRYGSREYQRIGGYRDRMRIFYGNQYNLKQGSVVYSAPEVNDFTCYRNVPCHQVCFYDARLFAERGYDLKYRVRADYEHFLYCIYEKKAEAVYVEQIVADYEGGGFSETRENRIRSQKEHREITRRYLGREKVIRYRAILLLTLAPLRTRLAENEKYAAAYNRIKTAVYKRLKRKL